MLANKHLDISMTYMRQDSKNLEALECEVSSNTKRLRHTVTGLQALEKFPRIQEFIGNWPIHDLLKMRLKFTSSRERRVVVTTAGLHRGKYRGKVRVQCVITLHIAH